MGNKSTKARSNNSIGKEQYQFDYELEKNIYSYLYGIHKKKHKKLKEEFKFQDYCEWKRYVYNKYKEYDSEKLIGFSRYLKQKISSEKPEHEYWKICIPIVLSIIVSRIPELMEGLQNIDFLKSIGSYIILILMLFVLLICPLVYCLYSLMSPLWESNTRENLLMDYKEIIDDLIEKKEKSQKRAKNKKS